MKKSAHLIEYFRMGGHVSVFKWCKLKIIYPLIGIENMLKYSLTQDTTNLVTFLCLVNSFLSFNIKISIRKGSLLQNNGKFSVYVKIIVKHQCKMTMFYSF